jgi:hypothetical protein
MLLMWLESVAKCHSVYWFLFQHWLDPTKAIKKQVKSKWFSAYRSALLPCRFFVSLEQWQVLVVFMLVWYLLLLTLWS